MSKTNENIQIIIPDSFFSRLKKSHLLLDTSVFIDASNHPIEFMDFFQKCRQNDITLTTCHWVMAEVTKGSQNSEVFQNKKDFLLEIISDPNSANHSPYLVSTNEAVLKELIELTQMYKEYGKKVSITDFFLAALLKKYKSGLFLLTKNPQDFPLTIFSRVSYLLLEMKRSLQIYGVYQYA